MDGGEVGIKVPLVVLAASMTCWTVGVRRSHPSVSFYALQCAVTTGWSASAFLNLFVMSLKTPVIPVWYCSAVLDNAGRLISDHWRN